jgi:ABC-type transport system involved in multi-copper enzyme maturation permease subunit
MPIFTIMRLTFLEAARRRIALAAVLLGAAFLVVYGIALFFLVNETGLPPAENPASILMRAQVFNFLSLAGMYAVNFLGIALGALVSADTLAGEISSGTIQALVTKPVRRAEIVLGKWLGFAILLAAYMGLMIGGVMALVYWHTGYLMPNLLSGLGLIYLESLVIMSLTLAFSSMFSTLATGGLVFGLWGVAFIGGFVEQVGAMLGNRTVVNVGIISSLILPTEAVFRRAGFLMSSAASQALGMSAGPMFVVSVPSPLVVVYAALYVAVLVALTIRVFGRRDL